MSTHWERKERAREEKLKLIDEQVESGSLVIRAMTPAERRDPTLLNGSRRRRIAAGSGADLPEVNRLVKQFGEMQKLMKQMGGLAKSGRLPRIPGMPRLG